MCAYLEVVKAVLLTSEMSGVFDFKRLRDTPPGRNNR